MTVPQKPHKKKIIPPTTPSEDDENRPYVRAEKSNQNLVQTNHVYVQTHKQKIAKILQSKEETFHIKVTIWKLDKKTKYALSDSHVKADQESDLVIINPKLIKKLGLKVRPTSILAPYQHNRLVANGDSTELKSWVKFWVEVSGIQREMWAFVTPKDNPNVSLLLGLPWLRSVDAKLFIQKKEIHIGDSKKGEAVSQIPCSITSSEYTCF